MSEQIINHGFFNNKDLILCLSGGGSKALCFTGFYKVLYQRKLIANFQTFCGSSAGAFFNLLIILGYTDEETANLFFNTKFTEIYKEINITSMLNGGEHLCEANWLRRFIKESIIYKNYNYKTLTFQDLYEITGKTLIVTGVLRKNFNVVLFSRFTLPKQLVWKAIYGSMTVPIFAKSLTFDLSEYTLKNFPYEKSFLYEGKRLYGDDPICKMIDGGTVDNYPIVYFPLDKTLGVRLTKRLIDLNIEKDRPTPKKLTEKCIHVFSSFTDLIGGLMEQVELRHLFGKQIYEILLDTFEISTFSTSVSIEMKSKAYLNSIKVTHNFIENPVSHKVF